MVETLGVAASAIQVADVGVRLSSSLYAYIPTVSHAVRSTSATIAAKVDLTTGVVRKVGLIFDAPQVVSLRKEGAVASAHTALREGAAVFTDIEAAVAKSKRNWLTFPFRLNRFWVLEATLGSLKSDSGLLLRVLVHVRRISAAEDARARREAEEMFRRSDEAKVELRRMRLAVEAEEAGGQQQQQGAGNFRSSTRPASGFYISFCELKEPHEPDSSDDQQMPAGIDADVDQLCPSDRPDAFALGVGVEAHHHERAVERLISKTDAVDDQVSLNRARLESLCEDDPSASASRGEAGSQASASKRDDTLFRVSLWMATESCDQVYGTAEYEHSFDGVDALLRKWTNVYD